MRHFGLSILLTILISMGGTTVLAYDFSAINSDGITIYYNYIKNETELEVCSYSKKYKGEVNIPSMVTYNGLNLKVTSIGYSAFSSCINLTSVSIPNSVTSIGTYAFSGCKGLTSIFIPNSVTSINEKAFYKCSNLTSVTIGEGIVLIDYEAFSDCSLLTDVYCFAKEVPRTDDMAFFECFLDYATLHVPVNSIELYKKKKPWKEFKNIVALGSESPDIPSGEKCAPPTIAYQDGILRFSCATDGVVFQSTITDVDVTSYNIKEISLSATYNISVYATKTGMKNSDTVTATLCWIGVEPRKEGITNGIASVRAMPVMIQNDGGMLTINGVDDNTSIVVYDLNGIQVGSAISNNGVAYVNTNLSRDSIAIVKIGNKSVKVIVR